MITKTETFTISGGNAPYKWTLSTTNSCLTFSKTTDTLDADGSFSVDLIADNTACYANTQVTLTVVEVNNPQCSTVFNVTVNNPCGNLTLTSITQNDFSFSTLATGGNPNYNYNWTFDSNLFDTSGDSNITDNILNLTWNPQISPVPESTPITCNVTDASGCTFSISTSVSIPKPVGNNLEGVVPCSQRNNTCNTTNYGQISLLNSVTSSRTIDWTTLEVTTSGTACIENNNDGTINVGYDNTNSVVGIQLSYTVENDLGVKSDPANLVLTIPACNAANEVCYITATPTAIQLLATDSVSDVKTIATVSRVYSSHTIDWTTFTIVNTPAYGTAALNSNQDITYTITDNTTSTGTPDTIKWQVTNSCGNTVTITDVVNRDAIAAPVTVGDTVCAQCNTPTSATDITSNDTGNIDKSSIIIESIPNDVSYSQDSNNDFIFTAFPDSSLSRIIQYKVANSQGVYSNTSNVILSVTCAGTPNDYNIRCLVSKTFDLLDRFTDANAISYTFAETTPGGTTYIGQGGTIGAATGTVDFTSISNGTYTFRITAVGSGGCVTVGDDTADITIYHRADPAVSIGTIVDNGDGTYTIPYTTEGIQSLSNLTITVNSVAPSYTASPSFDSNGDGSFTVSSTTGHSVQITALTVCGTTINDTDTIP